MKCRICKIKTFNMNPPLCNYCKPNSCTNCHVSDVNYTNDTFKCSHGCEYSLSEYITRRVYTILLNSDWKQKLSIAGERVEYIIPNTESIQIHSNIPNHIDQRNVLAVHYTEDIDSIQTQQYNPKYNNNNPIYSETIRENAAYAWPYKPTYTESLFNWDKEYVIFEVPTSEVYVSSYSFLDWVSNSNDKFTIPLSKYKSELTFSPEQLKYTCDLMNRPTRKQNLL